MITCIMKRSSSPGSSDGPAQKCLSDIQRQRQILERYKQLYKQVDTSGTVIWSGTVKIPDSQKIVFDCSIIALPEDEGIKSLFPPKQLAIRILPVSEMKSLRPYRIQSILCMDGNTDMMSYSAFCQAIKLDKYKYMMGCTVLKSSASALHLLYVYCLSSEHEDYIMGCIKTYQANDTVLGILRRHGLLPCGNPGHHELAKQNAKLEEELRLKDKNLIEQQMLNQELERCKKEMEEKEREHEEERNGMERKMYSEFECYICKYTVYKACTLRCGHMFCYMCILQSLTTKANCPYCREQTGFFMRCMHIDRMITNLGVAQHSEEIVRASEERGPSQYEKLAVIVRKVDGEQSHRQEDARIAAWLDTLPLERPLSSPSSSSS